MMRCLGFRNNGSGQMMILTSIMLAVSIVVIAAIANSLSNVNVSLPREKSLSILSEYRNIREKFGLALAQRIGNYSDETWVRNRFDAVEKDLHVLEWRKGVYFDAEFGGITYSFDGSADGVIAVLTFRFGSSNICEEVEYNL